MEQLKTVNLNGLRRNSPQGTVDACDELINMRFHNNAWEPVGPKSTALGPNGEEFPAPGYSNITTHAMEQYTHWVGYSSATRKVVWYNPASLAILQEFPLNATEEINAIQVLKNYLIILTTENMYRYLWKEDSYSRIVLTGIENQFYTLVQSVDAETWEGPPDNPFNGIHTDPIWLTGDNEADSASVLGKYYKKLNELSGDSKFSGGFFYRTAIVLYDGSEILSSLPKYHAISDMGGILNFTPPEMASMIFSSASLQAKQYFYESTPGEFESYKDLILSVRLYASKVEYLYDVSDNTINKELFDSLLPASKGGIVPFGAVLPISDNFKKDIHDSNSWYRIGEISFGKLDFSVGSYSGEIDLDLKGFYTNYATAPLMLSDDFSHHEISANASDVYNDRLELGDIIQTLAPPAQMAMGVPPCYSPIILNPYGSSPAQLTYIPDAAFQVDTLIQVSLITQDGVKWVSIEGKANLLRDSLNANHKAIFYPALIGYPDYRADKMIINVKLSGVYYVVASYQLEKSVFGNFAFHVNDRFDVDATNTHHTSIIADSNFISQPITFDMLHLTPYTPHTSSNVSLDGNRVQISAVNNPFVFPAKNSSQVGTGKVLAFGTNTEDVSSGQFGQYPIYTFTSQGMWALEIGTGEVYITNVLPLNGEVIRDRFSGLNLSFGVAFITSEGIKIISGKEIVDISDPIEGLPGTALLANLHLQHYVSHPSLVQLSPMLDGFPFSTYLLGARLGFNKGSDRSEILVNNSNYPYHYVYDIENKVWSKVGRRIVSFIRNYPNLYAVDYALSKVVNISKEVDGTVQVLFLTRALNLDMGETFKKTRRSFLRCQIKTNPNKFAAAYIFQSDDLRVWKYATGNDHNTGEFTNIWITHSPRSSRFYAYLFVAELEVKAATNTNRISGIEIQVASKRDGKLR